LKQQPLEPVAQFAVKLNQLLSRADPVMLEKMKLFFLWPRICHDLARRVHDQGPTTFAQAIEIARRIETSNFSDQQNPFAISHPIRVYTNSQPTPMDIVIQNIQAVRRALPMKNAQGRPKCFNCNNYGHVKKYYRKWKVTELQNAQVLLMDSASLTKLLGNK
jgi:hypothetical protein